MPARSTPVWCGGRSPATWRSVTAVGWFSWLKPEPGLTMVFHTEAMAAIDEQKSVKPYACGPLISDPITLWMFKSAEQQYNLDQLHEFMTTRGRTTLPGVLLREPDGSRPNQVAVAAGGIRAGSLPDDIAEHVAPAIVQLKHAGWLAVGSLRFERFEDQHGNGEWGCRLVLPDLAGLAAHAQPIG